jgi:hypothetical protein
VVFVPQLGLSVCTGGYLAWMESLSSPSMAEVLGYKTQRKLEVFVIKEKCYFKNPAFPKVKISKTRIKTIK